MCISCRKFCVSVRLYISAYNCCDGVCRLNPLFGARVCVFMCMCVFV